MTPDVVHDAIAQARVGGEKFPSEITRAHSPRVFGLDLLRACAISAVYLAHGAGMVMPHLSWWTGLIGHFGFYGVELFFVLSGFLIGGILIRTGERLRESDELLAFYLRRWFRTLPLFFLFVPVNVIIDAAVSHHYLTAGEIITHALFLRNLTGFHLTFFGESWSLAVEEWFYLLFPFALWLGLRATRRFDFVLLAVALAFFLFSNIGRIFSAPLPQATWTQWQREAVFFRFDALMLGVFAAWLAMRRALTWRKWAPLSAVAGVVLLSVLYGTLWKISGHALAPSADNFFARTFRFTLVSLGFALLLPLASSWTVARENLFTANVHRVALWSYALYLVHTPLVLIIRAYGPRQPAESALGDFVLFIFQTTVCVTASALLYRFFESRCTQLRERFVPRLLHAHPS